MEKDSTWLFCVVDLNIAFLSLYLLFFCWVRIQAAWEYIDGPWETDGLLGKVEAFTGPKLFYYMHPSLFIVLIIELTDSIADNDRYWGFDFGNSHFKNRNINTAAKKKKRLKPHPGRTSFPWVSSFFLFIFFK